MFGQYLNSFSIFLFFLIVHSAICQWSVEWILSLFFLENVYRVSVFYWYWLFINEERKKGLKSVSCLRQNINFDDLGKVKPYQREFRFFEHWKTYKCCKRKPTNWVEGGAKQFETYFIWFFTMRLLLSQYCLLLHDFLTKKWLK